LSELSELAEASLDGTDIEYSIRILDKDGNPLKNSGGDLIEQVSGIFTFDTTAPTKVEFEDELGNSIDGVDLSENVSYQSTALFKALADDPSPITYELSEDSQKYFNINPSSGAVSIKQDAISGLWQFDFESIDVDGVRVKQIDSDTKEILVTVNAVDAASNEGQSSDIRVSVSNLDESAPVFDPEDSAEDGFDAVVTVEEYVEDGALVYTPTNVTDIFDDDTARDVTDQVRFSLAKTGDFQYLTVDSLTGAVSLKASPDFEAKSAYVFTLVATGGDGKTSSQLVRLDVNKGGTAANFVSLEQKNPVSAEYELIELSELRLGLVSIEENTGLAAYSWKIRVDDPEAVLSLKDDANNYFEIIQQTASPEYWDLTFKDGVTLDYEALEVLNFSIRMVDLEGVPKDLDLAIPVIDDGANPSFARDSQTIFTSEVLAGESFQVTLATLASGDSEAITYSIVENEDPNTVVPFSIDPTTGEMTALEHLDYETTPNYDLTIRATNGTEYTDKDLFIKVSDKNPGGPQVESASWNTATLDVELLSALVTFNESIEVNNIGGITATFRLEGNDSNGELVSKLITSTAYEEPDDNKSISFTIRPPENTDFEGVVELFSISLNDDASIMANGNNADLIFSPVALDPKEEGAEIIWRFNTVDPFIETIELSEEGFEIVYNEELDIPQNTTFTLETIYGDTLAIFDPSKEGGIKSLIFTFAEGTTRDSLLLDLKSINSLFFNGLDQIKGIDTGNSADNLLQPDLVTLIDLGKAFEYDSDNGEWVEVQIVAGEFVTDSLIISLQNLDGEILAEADFNPLVGVVSYGDLISSASSGPILVNIRDGSVKLDYIDEFTGQLTDFGATTSGFGLRAIVDIHEGISSEAMRVTPLTELAVRLAEAKVEAATTVSLDGAYDQALANLRSLFGLAGAQGAIQVITDEQFDLQDGISAAESEGLVLAALSTLDNLTGGINATLEVLANSENYDQNKVDSLIEQAVNAVSESTNVYIQNIAQELTATLERFHEYQSIFESLGMTNNSPETDADLLDLSAYLLDDGEYELFIDGEQFDLINLEKEQTLIESAIEQLNDLTHLPHSSGAFHLDIDTDTNTHG
jgi:hypothetical protein